MDSRSMCTGNVYWHTGLLTYCYASDAEHSTFRATAKRTCDSKYLTLSSPLFITATNTWQLTSLFLSEVPSSLLMSLPLQEVTRKGANKIVCCHKKCDSDCHCITVIQRQKSGRNKVTVTSQWPKHLYRAVCWERCHWYIPPLYLTHVQMQVALVYLHILHSHTAFRGSLWFSCVT